MAAEYSVRGIGVSNQADDPISLVPRLRPRGTSARPGRDLAGHHDVQPFFSEAVTLTNISLLAQIWRRRETGYLTMRDGTEEAQILLVSRGGLVDTADLIELGSSIGRVDLSFDPSQLEEEGDWLGLGSLLYHLADEVVVPREELFEGPLELRPQPGFEHICELPLDPATREELLASSWRSGSTTISVERPTRLMVHTVEVLRRMGLAVLLHRRKAGEGAGASDAGGPALLPFEEVLLDAESELIFSWDLEEGAVFELEVAAESEQSQLELVIAARRAAARGDWAEADAHLCVARDRRLDNPLVLAWLAWVRLNLAADSYTPEDGAQALAWVELASTIAPHNADILRLAGQIRLFISSRD